MIGVNISANPQADLPPRGCSGLVCQRGKRGHSSESDARVMDGGGDQALARTQAHRNSNTAAPNGLRELRWVPVFVFFPGRRSRGRGRMALGKKKEMTPDKPSRSLHSKRHPKAKKQAVEFESGCALHTMAASPCREELSTSAGARTDVIRELGENVAHIRWLTSAQSERLLLLVINGNKVLQQP